jgi:hypothetical protein
MAMWSGCSASEGHVGVIMKKRVEVEEMEMSCGVTYIVHTMHRTGKWWLHVFLQTDGKDTSTLPEGQRSEVGVANPPSICIGRQDPRFLSPRVMFEGSFIRSFVSEERFDAFGFHALMCVF